MIAYRKAGYGDIPALLELRGMLLTEANDLPVGDYGKIAGAIREYFEKSLADGSFEAWISLDGEKAAAASGICYYSVPPSFNNPTGKSAYIMNMYTLPEYRRQGIAEELFKRLLEGAKAREAAVITLIATEMGRPLYEKLGFRQAAGYMVYP